MDSEPVSPALTTDSQDIDLYHTLGGMDGCRRLAVAFYSHVKRDPVIRSLYPPTLKCSTETIAAFFTQFFGGPYEYVQRRWSLSLREAHLRFTIGDREREAWLGAMFRAIDEVSIKEPTRSSLHWFFEQASAFFINQSPDTAYESPPLENPIRDQQKLEISRIHKEIAHRWQAQQALEELIAAVRQENADVVLTLLESPVIQVSFTEDRAAFLSCLAILSSSSQPVLLDYVRQILVNDTRLVHERYTYDRTLLHELAGQGSLSIVQLLLHLGADPNAVDQWGHTPLYFVGNASHSVHGADVVHILVQGGASVNAQERLKHCTALHMAARRGNVSVAEALLECGADIEARDKLGDTPLHRAVKCGKVEIVTFFLSRGADVNAKGKSGLTPLQVARGAFMKQLLQASSGGEAG
jgi:truncated hemoglobin YjbI